VSGYSVDLEELLTFADRLDRFNKRSETIATAVDQQIAELHGTWSGLGADSEKQYHETWMKLAKEMRATADGLRQTATVAHGNYTDVAELNSSMWP
jgi:WXG100 family type VII secretion target